ncbi:MAG: GNAT family N-acetyltransferase [Leptolyngbyaceae cyanobacterium]
MPKYQRRDRTKPHSQDQPNFLPRTAVTQRPASTEKSNQQKSVQFHQNLSPIPNTAQRQPKTNKANIQIASPKPSEHGYQKIAATAGSGKSIGSVQIKGSAAQGKMEMASLWVNPEHRQQGVSKSLISAATQVGKQQGYRKAALGVDPEAPGMSTSTLKNIYTRQGFKSSGKDTHGRPLMEKDL